MTDSYIEVKEIFNTHLLKNKAPEPTILEVHSFDLIFDQEFSGFESMSSDDSYSEKLMKLKRKYRLSEVSKSAIRSAISVARKDTSLASTTFTDTNASNDSRLSSGLSSDFLNGTLSDVINFIVNKSNDHGICITFLFIMLNNSFSCQLQVTNCLQDLSKLQVRLVYTFTTDTHDFVGFRIFTGVIKCN